MNDLALQVALVVKNLPANAGDKRDMNLIESGRFPAGRQGNPLQYPCLENLWQATVHRVAKCRHK